LSLEQSKIKKTEPKINKRLERENFHQQQQEEDEEYAGTLEGGIQKTAEAREGGRQSKQKGREDQSNGRKSRKRGKKSLKETEEQNSWEQGPTTQTSGQSVQPQQQQERQPRGARHPQHSSQAFQHLGPPLRQK
jgi:hypothetical protein